MEIIWRFGRSWNDRRDFVAQTVFNRYEKKYLMPENVYCELRQRLSAYMQEDAYGLHTICNIYYDTPDSSLIRRSIEKPQYKEKTASSQLRNSGTGVCGVFLRSRKI